MTPARLVELLSPFSCSSRSPTSSSTPSPISPAGWRNIVAEIHSKYETSNCTWVCAKHYLLRASRMLMAVRVMFRAQPQYSHPRFRVRRDTAFPFTDNCCTLCTSSSCEKVRSGYAYDAAKSPTSPSPAGETGGEAALMTELRELCSFHRCCPSLSLYPYHPAISTLSCIVRTFASPLLPV